MKGNLPTRKGQERLKVAGAAYSQTGSSDNAWHVAGPASVAAFRQKMHLCGKRAEAWGARIKFKRYSRNRI